MTQVLDILKLEEKHAKDYQALISIPATVELPIEIDSEVEFDTEMFRVWYGEANLGVFRISNEGWLAEPFYGNPSRAKTLCTSPHDARDAIVAAYQVSKGVM